ncbi:MAG: hypothetical protein J7641_22565 [Cyanobacteria bacterium SID2]|nr:hypothetical protein [Cyanobacteria bacterium SID2]MBP0005201.1 hypothetical protein [Cyanobacteria bacterium SBC]
MTKRSSIWLLGLGLFAALAVSGFGRPTSGWMPSATFAVGQAVRAQTPVPLPNPPSIPPSESTAPENTSPLERPADFELEQVPPADGDTAGLTLGEGAYSEPGQFQIGTIEGYTMAVTAGIPLFESPDRSLAYTALSKRRANPRVLADDELVQLVLETLDRGENFQTGGVISTAPGEILMNWTASIKDAPITGKVLVRQIDRQVLMLVVSATASGADKVDAAISVLSETLQVAPTDRAAL